ncbi:hypothetical protein COCOBI_14-3860 [Coccomyxa sp. Obi]|nr:hypothetical protein COCOBI_14-3860 [Coccomyxa sp. Obi]
MGALLHETTYVQKRAGAQTDKDIRTTGGAAQTGTGGRGGAVCDTKYYTTVEDRPVEKEIVERVVEHHPVEKKFVVETRPAGEHELADQRRTRVSAEVAAVSNAHMKDKKLL